MKGINWQDMRMHDLESIAEDCENRMSDINAQIEMAEDEGDTGLVNDLKDEYNELARKRDKAMNEWGLLDEGFTPGSDPDYYYPSPLDIAAGWV